MNSERIKDCGSVWRRRTNIGSSPEQKDHQPGIALNADGLKKINENIKEIKINENIKAYIFIRQV